MVELLIFYGHPFHDHWTSWIRSHSNSDISVAIHATGDMRNGFIFEIKRSHNIGLPEETPSKRIPLQWVNGEHFNEQAMLNDGEHKIDNHPDCAFEASAHKIQPPEKSLNTFQEESNGVRKVTQRDCQTWIVESADQLVSDGIISHDVSKYLHLVKQ